MKKTVTSEPIARKDMGYYDARNRTYIIESGEFKIQIGDIRLKSKVTTQ